MFFIRKSIFYYSFYIQTNDFPSVSQDLLYTDICRRYTHILDVSEHLEHLRGFDINMFFWNLAMNITLTLIIFP